jgi:hypothetical protein
MKAIFCEHWLEIEEVFTVVDEHELGEVESQELKELIEELFHQQTLSLILEHLPQDCHQPFLVLFQAAPFDQSLIDFVKGQIKIDIEAEIKKQAQKIKAEILAEIRKSKKRTTF